MMFLVESSVTVVDVETFFGRPDLVSTVKPSQSNVKVYSGAEESGCQNEGRALTRLMEHARVPSQNGTNSWFGEEPPLQIES